MPAHPSTRGLEQIRLGLDQAASTARAEPKSRRRPLSPRENPEAAIKIRRQQKAGLVHLSLAERIQIVERRRVLRERERLASREKILSELRALWKAQDAAERALEEQFIRSAEDAEVPESLTPTGSCADAEETVEDPDAGSPCGDKATEGLSEQSSGSSETNAPVRFRYPDRLRRGETWEEYATRNSLTPLPPIQEGSESPDRKKTLRTIRPRSTQLSPHVEESLTYPKAVDTFKAIVEYYPTSSSSEEEEIEKPPGVKTPGDDPLEPVDFVWVEGDPLRVTFLTGEAVRVQLPKTYHSDGVALQRALVKAITSKDLQAAAVAQWGLRRLQKKVKSFIFTWYPDAYERKHLWLPGIFRRWIDVNQRAQATASQSLPAIRENG